MEAGERFEQLVALMARLRGPEGCPWDREQTIDSLRPYILEEAYELVDAISSSRGDAIREELGDLLLEVLFVSQICAERGLFTVDEVLQGLAGKMLRRHPHVFGPRRAVDAGEALAHWESIKADERRPERESLLQEVPRALPALLRATKLSAQAARAGFDWRSVEEILGKLEEELGELDSARASGRQQSVREEVGDLLFVMANIARHLGVDPELALDSANRKFLERFREIEERLRAEGRSLSESTLEEMEALWQQAKHRQESSPDRDP